MARAALSEEALLAVARLIALAASSANPDAVERAVVHEARQVFGADAAVLLRGSRSRRHAAIVAAEPQTDASQRRLRTEFVPGLRGAFSDRTPSARFAGGSARALAKGIGSPDTTKVALALALRPGDPLRHVLVLTASDPDALGPQTLPVATAFASAAAGSLDQLSAAAEHAELAARQAALARAAKSLTGSLDLEEVLVTICREACTILDADSATIYRGTPHEGVTVVSTWGFGPEVIGYHLPPGKGLSGRAAAEDRAMYTNDYQHETIVPTGSPFSEIQSCAAAPMHWDGELRGTLTVGHRHRDAVTYGTIELLVAFAELAAAACRNATAYAGAVELARTDGLTGCLNHAAFQDTLAREVARAGRTGSPLSLIMLDLDSFKQVNEEQGHLIGDEVLRRVGHALRHAVRPYDGTGRYGGDEFAVVATDTTEAVAVGVASRALVRISGALEDVQGAGAPGATAGVGQWREGMTPQDLVAAADAALLFGKRHGRRGMAIPASELSEHDAAMAVPRRVAPVAAAPSPATTDATTERLRKRTRQLALANALGTRLAAMTDPELILDTAADELHKGFGYAYAAMIRVRDDGYVESAASRGDPVAKPGEQRWCQPRSVGVIGRALRERRVVIVNDTRAEPAYQPFPHTPDVRSEVTAPVWVGDRLWGAINVEETEVGAFDDEDAQLIQTVADQVGSALRSAHLFEQLERAYMGTAEALAAALEAKDSYTAHHARWIVELSAAVGERLGMDEEGLRNLRYGAIFHDIGKIAVPEAILNKRGALSPEERELIERHTIVGEQILAPVDFLAEVAPVVRHEHERWDGAGYPDGLAGDAIPLGARIVFACDAYHAMTSDRPYRDRMSCDQARAELLRHAGTQFDPVVVGVLLDVLDGQGTWQDSTPLGAVAESGRLQLP